MRSAPSERHQAERFLELEGWHLVKIIKSKTLPVEPYYEMLEWCDENIGPGCVEPDQIRWIGKDDIWYAFTWYGYYNFHFKHSKDATAFALRWV